MRKTTTKIILPIIMLFGLANIGFGQGLFFSEYIEGQSNSNNRAFEIYNGTGATIDLSNYVVMQSRSSVGWAMRDTDNDGVLEYLVSYVLSLSGTLETGNVYVVYNNQADAAIAVEGDLMLTYGEAAGSRNASFTGNDALGLFEVTNSGNDTTLIDIIGTEILGTASTWNVAGIAGATMNHTLVRKLSVTTGNATEWAVDGGAGSAGSTTDDSEWIVYDADEFNYLGYHGLNTANDILTFVFAQQTTGATINTETHTVDIEVAYGTIVTALVPTITLSYGATVSPESGAAQDFSIPAIYTVTAEDSGTQDWTVTVTVKAPNTGTDILTFTLAQQAGDAIIDDVNHTVNIEVIAGTSVTALVPTITVSEAAGISPDSEVAKDFTNPVPYTVTAEDGTTQDWLVIVTIASVSAETDITSFEVHVTENDIIMVDSAVIDLVNHTVNIIVEMETEITALIPVIEVSPGATIDPATGVARDFTDTVTYTVTAQDGITTQEWVVTVTVFEYPVVSIYDIQYTEDASGDSPMDGQTVTITGIVTAVEPSGGFFLQDAPGLWHGIYVYTPTGDIGVVGDSVVFSGSVSEYYGLSELSWVEDFSVISSGHELPEAITLTASQMTESIEGVLIHLEEFTCVNVDFDTHDNSLYVNANEPNDTLMVHDLLFEFGPVLNNEYTFTGIGTFDFDNFKIEPRDTDDVIILTVVNNAPVIENIYSSPEFPTTGDNEVYILADIIDDVEIISKAFYYGLSINDISIEIELEPVGFGGIQFRALLPVFDQATELYFKFVASDIEFTTEFIDSIYVSDIPMIENVTISPEPPVTEPEAIVSATITDFEGIENAIIYWSISEDDFNSEMSDSMTTEGDDIYTGIVTIPQVTKSIAPLYIKIEATDILGNIGVYLGSFEADFNITLNIVLENINIYPNPANHKLFISGLNNINQIVIISILGKEIYRQKIEDNSLDIDLGNFENGIYFIRIYSDSGKSGTLKFIKQ